MLYINKNSLKS